MAHPGINNGEKGTSNQIWQHQLISVWIQFVDANLALGMRAPAAAPRIKKIAQGATS